MTAPVDSAPPISHPTVKLAEQNPYQQLRAAKRLVGKYLAGALFQEPAQRHPPRTPQPAVPFYQPRDTRPWISQYPGTDWDRIERQIQNRLQDWDQ